MSPESARKEVSNGGHQPLRASSKPLAQSRRPSTRQLPQSEMMSLVSVAIIFGHLQWSTWKTLVLWVSIRTLCRESICWISLWAILQRCGSERMNMMMSVTHLKMKRNSNSNNMCRLRSKSTRMTETLYWKQQLMRPSQRNKMKNLNLRWN